MSGSGTRIESRVEVGLGWNHEWKWDWGRVKSGSGTRVES